jgi:hypothetical protein
LKPEIISFEWLTLKIIVSSIPVIIFLILIYP